MQATSQVPIGNATENDLTVENHQMLSPEILQKFDVPSGGKWFFTQSQMLDVNTSETFAVAWDKREQDGSKLYGTFGDARAFFEGLHANTPDKRWGYELIPENSPCKLYADIEWIGENDKNHERLEWILTNLHDYCKDRYKRSPELYVCCSSRERKDGKFKNSYHVVSPSVVFPNNHDGTMKVFFSNLCCGSEWLHTDGESYVDMRVYTKNRCVRLPLCCKKGSSVPFTRISGDPLKIDLEATFQSTDPDMWLPFILTNLTIDDNVLLIPSLGAHDKKKPGAASSDDETVLIPSAYDKKRPRGAASSDDEKRSKRHCDTDDTPLLPIPLNIINEALKLCGDTVSIVTKTAFVKSERVWQIQCDQKQQPRMCLSKKQRIHNSNNCILFVKPLEADALNLSLHIRLV
jgi:hypothetical protein